MTSSNRLRYFLVLLAAIVSYCGCSRSKKQAAAHIAELTSGEMKQIRDSLSLYSIDTHKAPWKDETNISAKLIFQALSFETNKMTYLPENPRWARAGSLVDPWENEYNFLVISAKSTETNSLRGQVHRVSIWSNGPNGLNDKKTMDDIVLDPFEIKNR
jgi:hypothetical protein